MKKLEGLEAQLFWYAKGWFKKTDIIGDLRTIVAWGVDLVIEDVPTSLILEWISQLFVVLVKHDASFYQELFTYVDEKGQLQLRQEVDIQRVIERMLAKISTLESGDFVEAGKPNFDILPAAD